MFEELHVNHARYRSDIPDRYKVKWEHERNRDRRQAQMLVSYFAGLVNAGRADVARRKLMERYSYAICETVYVHLRQVSKPDGLPADLDALGDLISEVLVERQECRSMNEKIVGKEGYRCVDRFQPVHAHHDDESTGEKEA